MSLVSDEIEDASLADASLATVVVDARLALFGGRLEAALAMFEGASAAAEPTVAADACHGRALALERLNRVDDALRACREALDRDPIHRGALLTMSSLHAARSEWLPALMHLERLRALDGESALVRHLVRWIGGAELNTAPSRAEIVELFDGYAESFESHLVANLEYQGHLMAARALQVVCAERHAQWRVLDLGCGTGLCGGLVRPLAGHLTGIDVSPLMVEQARQSGHYDVVYVADIVYALACRPAASADLLLAADVFHYFGDFEAVLVESARVLTPHGRLVFCAECAEDPAFDGFTMHPRTRRCHYGESYLRRLAASAGLEIELLRREPMRRERDGHAMAFACVLRAPATG